MQKDYKTEQQATQLSPNLCATEIVPFLPFKQRRSVEDLGLGPSGSGPWRWGTSQNHEGGKSESLLRTNKVSSTTASLGSGIWAVVDPNPTTSDAGVLVCIYLPCDSITKITWLSNAMLITLGIQMKTTGS